MAALPYIQLYVADYLGDTYHLTTEEHGAYLLLIMTYWQSGKPIHKSRLPSATRMTNERWANAERTLNEYFTEDENGYWIHDRIENDLRRVNAKCRQASRAGKASAAKRSAPQPTENKEDSNGRSTDVQQESQRTFNHTDTYTDTNKHTSTSNEPDKFDLFWENYPRKESKKKAQTTFKRLPKTKQDLAIADCKTRFEDTQRQFIPLPTSYLNAERWEDEIKVNGYEEPKDWI